MKKFKIILVLSVFILSLISLFVCYDCVAKGVTSGLILCSDVVIPSLFPILCITSSFANSGVITFFSKYFEKISKKLFNLSGYFVPVFLLSLVSGYPVGAALSNTLYNNGKISLSERNNIASVSCSAGPGFILLAVGVSLLKSYEAGVILLIVHITASIAVAFIVSRFFKYDCFASKNNSNICIGDALVKGIGSAAGSIISICAYTVLFSAVVNVISKYLRFSVFYLPLVSVLEVTNAVYALSNAKVPLAFISAAVGFGGFSVIFQISSVLGNNRPPISEIITIRLLHSFLSFVFCSILIEFYDYSLPVVKTSETFFIPSSKNFLFSFSLILLAIVFFSFYYRRYEKRNICNF